MKVAIVKVFSSVSIDAEGYNSHVSHCLVGLDYQEVSDDKFDVLRRAVAHANRRRNTEAHGQLILLTAVPEEDKDLLIEQLLASEKRAADEEERRAQQYRKEQEAREAKALDRKVKRLAKELNLSTDEVRKRLAEKASLKSAQ